MTSMVLAHYHYQLDQVELPTGNILSMKYCPPIE